MERTKSSLDDNWQESEPFDPRPEIFALNPQYIQYARYRKSLHITSDTYYQRGRHLLEIYTHDGKRVEFEVKDQNEAEVWIGFIKVQFTRL